MTRDQSRTRARERNLGRAQDRGVARPRGALLVVAGVCAVLIGGGAAFATYRLVAHDEGAGPAPSPPPPSSAAPPAPAPSAPPPSASSPETRGASGWQETAEAYGQAFTNTSGGKQAWLGRLEDLVSPSLAQGYAYTDLAVVPREDFLTATGGAEVAGETPSRAVRLEYTAGLLVDVTVSRVPATKRWVVATAVPAEPTPAEPVTADPVAADPVLADPMSGQGV